jgi:hypothetical protein
MCAGLKSISQIGTFSTVDFTTEGFGETRTNVVAGFSPRSFWDDRNAG